MRPSHRYCVKQPPTIHRELGVNTVRLTKLLCVISRRQYPVLVWKPIVMAAVLVLIDAAMRTDHMHPEAFPLEDQFWIDQ